MRGPLLAWGFQSATGLYCHTSPWGSLLIECFHSWGQHLCKFIGTKGSVCIRKEFNSQRIVLGHQHGRRFIVLGHQYGHRDVMWKHSVDTRELIKQRRRRRRREQQKSNRFRPAQKTTTLHALRAFLYISSPSLHDYNVKVPNFTFCRGRERRQRLSLFLFLNFDTVFKNSTPENFANIWRIERVRIISAIKFELARIHFLSDVFVDVGRRCCLFKLA